MNKIAKWMNINSKHKILIIFLISFILISGQCSNTENDATVIAAEQVQTEIEEETEEIAAEPELETEKEEQITIGPYTYLIAAQTATQQNEIHLERPAIWTNQNGTGFKELLPLREDESVHGIIDTDVYIIFSIFKIEYTIYSEIIRTIIYRKSDGYIFEYPADYDSHIVHAFDKYLVRINSNNYAYDEYRRLSGHNYTYILLDVSKEGTISVIKELTMSETGEILEGVSKRQYFLDGFMIDRYYNDNENREIIYQLINMELTKIGEVFNDCTDINSSIIAINNSTLYYKTNNDTLVSVNLETKQETVLGIMRGVNELTKCIGFMNENIYRVIDLKNNNQIRLTDVNIEDDRIILEGYKIVRPISITNQEFVFDGYSDSYFNNNSICYYNIKEKKIIKTIDVSIPDYIRTIFPHDKPEDVTVTPFANVVICKNYYCRTIFGEAYIFSLKEGGLTDHFIADWLIPFRERPYIGQICGFNFFESGDTLFMYGFYLFIDDDK